ncbi:MAG TPA: NAD(P)H-dependent oxidoreductase [Gammaproteobacteria bacterium]
MNKTIIIFGNSSRPDDNRNLVDEVAREFDLRIIDLADFDINGREVNDALIELIEQVIHADTVIFATPVFCYSMSPRMKLFIDRLTDLARVDEELKEMLRGKRGLLLSTGTEAIPPKYFEETFSLLLAYLGIEYGGMLYLARNADPAPEQIRAFGNKAIVEMGSWSEAAA